MPPEMPHMVRNFDDNANALWSLHLKEAKSHDEARIQTLKDDMDGVLIFVRVYISTIIFCPELMHSRQAGLFSAALTSFVTDKIQSIQRSYQQQNVALLAQISNQVFSIAPQVSIPSTPPPPYPDFCPNYMKAQRDGTCRWWRNPYPGLSMFRSYSSWVLVTRSLLYTRLLASPLSF